MGLPSRSLLTFVSLAQLKKETSMIELERQRRAKEEEKQAQEKLLAEEQRREEKKQKELDQLRKEDLKRRPTNQQPKKLTADQQKKKERKEKEAADEELRQAKARSEYEKEQVRKEVAVFNQVMMRVRNAFERVGSSVFDYLRLADTNGDGAIDLREFMATLHRQKVQASQEDILFIHNLLDGNKDGKVQYKELQKLVNGQFSRAEIEAAVSRRRAEKGEDHGLTPSELQYQQRGSNVNQTEQSERTVGTRVSGLTTLQQRSDVEERVVPSLVDEHEHAKNIQVIRECIQERAKSFEEVL